MDVARLLIFLLLIIVCNDVTNAVHSPDQTPPDDPCTRALQEVKEGDTHAFKPTCNNDGSFKSKQCNNGDCWCVLPLTGTEIPDTRSGPSQPAPKCGVPLDPFNYKVTLGESTTFSIGIEKLLQSDSSSAMFSRQRRGQATDGHQCGRITSVPRHLTFITRYNYYRRYTHAYNIPIVSSARVGDAALNRACYVLRFLLADRKALRKYLFLNYGRIGIIGRYEHTTGIPEHSFLGPSWNARARGLGGTLAVPISTGTEENLLCERTDRYPREDIFLHEFSHGIQEVAVRGGGIPGYFRRLTAAYNSARYRGLWRSTYAMSTVQEYFAEGTQSYFNVNDYAPRANGIHGPINTRAKLRRYDPTLYALVREVFPCENTIWKRCTGGRMPPFKMNCDGNGVEVTVGGKKTTKPTRKPIAVTTADPPKPPIPPIPPIPTKPTPYTCLDNNPYCHKWSKRGFCIEGTMYIKYMMKHCRKSCGCCGNISKHCGVWSKYCTHRTYGRYMDKNCKNTCETCRKFANQK